MQILFTDVSAWQTLQLKMGKICEIKAEDECTISTCMELLWLALIQRVGEQLRHLLEKTLVNVVESDELAAVDVENGDGFAGFCEHWHNDF